jgi:hypothetical protein
MVVLLEAMSYGIQYVCAHVSCANLYVNYSYNFATL